MLSMQDFRKWLTSTTTHPNDYRDHLARLTRVSRGQILNITSELAWYIWYADGAASSL